MMEAAHDVMNTSARGIFPSNRIGTSYETGSHVQPALGLSILGNLTGDYLLSAISYSTSFFEPTIENVSR